MEICAEELWAILKVVLKPPKIFHKCYTGYRYDVQN